MSVPAFSLLFCGTGAADYNWAEYGKAGIRGSCSTLINGKILIDAGKTGYRSLISCKANIPAIEEIWFTHSHCDHCYPQEIVQIAADRSTSRPLILRGDREVIKYLQANIPVDAQEMFEYITIRPLREFKTGEFTVIPLPGNHCALPEETPLHYLISAGGKSIYYALDGAWMTTHARNALTGYVLDLVVWDATVYAPGDWRLFEHNDLSMVATMTKGLIDAKIITADTKLVLDHVAHSLWPKPMTAPPPYILAEDGMVIEV